MATEKELIRQYRFAFIRAALDAERKVLQRDFEKLIDIEDSRPLTPREKIAMDVLGVMLMHNARGATT